MDKQQTMNTMNQQPMGQPPEQPVQQPTPQPTLQTASVSYASFLNRLLAVLIDSILIAIAGGVLGALLRVGLGQSSTTIMLINTITSLLGVTYAVYMISKYGATVGKMALGIKVQNESTGQNLTIVEAFLREVVGKFVSALILLLGYLWMLWDPKKQTWHDKLAHSIVVKVK